MRTATSILRGAFALELAPDDNRGVRDALPQADAGVLAAAIACDLARCHGDASLLKLTTVGAHYDPVELLRPGWPVHHALDQLGARAPGGDGDAVAGGRIVAFGSHDGRLPDALSPSPDYLGGPLRLLPWQLRGDAAVVRRVGDAFERELMERGMASAETALLAQQGFGLRIAHARLLTLHDLCALMAMQYDHAGLAPLWPLLEAALLSPDREVWLDAGREPLLHYVDREARIALFGADAWRARYGDIDVDSDAAARQRDFKQFEARQRQFAAVLMAHGVPVMFVHCSGDPIADL
ncbi:MAG: hypothetical protein ACREO8_05440 [Luteimonas sp.]